MKTVKRQTRDKHFVVQKKQEVALGDHSDARKY